MEGMGNLPNGSDRRPATPEGKSPWPTTFALAVAGLVLYIWGGALGTAGGGLSFDNHFGPIYTTMAVTGGVLITIALFRVVYRRK
jgi:uncharacterized membrane protein YdjX (TVP38/TMEM64 family)